MQAFTQNQVAQWSLVSSRGYEDPFSEIELDAVFEHESGKQYRVPAFWAGDSVWRFRFAPPDLGKYSYVTCCSDTENTGLHGHKADFAATPCTGRNPLYTRGRLRISSDKRHFEHSNGTPFFWLGDTWWFGLCKRLEWPSGFLELALDRSEKGFSVIQIVAGPYPDMTAFDPRGANEAGFPWTEGFGTINPAYYDLADQRITTIIDLGMMPCIVGCWGYYLKEMGVEKTRRHWRHLVARYGAYPVVWCLAGEASMPEYLSETKDADRQLLKDGWTEVAGYVREIDPFHNLVTIHPTDNGRSQINDPSLLDFDMLQTGHGDRYSLPNTIKAVVDAYSREPLMPFINAEVCYEGIGEACRQEVQRLMFWCCVLQGAAGHTYGANGVWQANTPEQPHGPSPSGSCWGNTPWREAYKYPGSANLGLAKRLLERFEWWRIEPHPEWIEPRWSHENHNKAYAAGIPGELRLIFFPLSWWGTGTVKGIEEDARYTAYLFDPSNGDEIDLGEVTADANGDWELPCGNHPYKVMPIYRDWILVLRNRRKEHSGSLDKEQE